MQSPAFHLLLIAGELLAVLISSLAIWTAVQLRTRQHRRGAPLDPPKNFLQNLVYVARTVVAYPHAMAVASVYFFVMVLVLALCRWNLWWLISPTGAYPSEKVFFLYRSSSPLAGASPILPLLLITAAAAVWMRGIFSQLAFFGHRIPRLPDGYEDIRCPSEQRVNGLNQLLSRAFGVNQTLRFVACMLTIVLLMSMAPHFGLNSLGHGPFDRVITLCTLLLGAIILEDLLTAALAWKRLRHDCLVPLRQSPLRWGFTWVKGFSWKRIWTSPGNLSSNQIFEYLMRLLETNDRVPTDSIVQKCYTDLAAKYASEPKDEDWLQNFTVGVAGLHDKVKVAAEERLKNLREEWKKDAGPLTGTDDSRGMHLLHKLEDLKDEPGPNGGPGLRERLLRRMGSEESVALLYVGYITAVLVQIRHRIVRSAALYILLMWALTSYPWMYRHAILLELSVLLAILSATTIWIYSQMHRDEILSRTTDTEAGKLESGFFERVIPVIGVPLLTLIASQFPEFSNVIFSWIQPGLSHMQ